MAVFQHVVIGLAKLQVARYGGQFHGGAVESVVVEGVEPVGNLFEHELRADGIARRGEIAHGEVARVGAVLGVEEARATHFSGDIAVPAERSRARADHVFAPYAVVHEEIQHSGGKLSAHRSALKYQVYVEDVLSGPGGRTIRVGGGIRCSHAFSFASSPYGRRERRLSGREALDDAKALRNVHEGSHWERRAASVVRIGLEWHSWVAQGVLSCEWSKLSYLGDSYVPERCCGQKRPRWAIRLFAKSRISSDSGVAAVRTSENARKSGSAFDSLPSGLYFEGWKGHGELARRPFGPFLTSRLKINVLRAHWKHF